MVLVGEVQEPVRQLLRRPVEARDQRPPQRQPLPDRLLCHLPGDVRRVAVVGDLRGGFILRSEREGDPRHAANDGFHGGSDGARIGHIVPDVGIRVNARDDEIDFFHEAQQRKRDTIRRCTIAGERRRTIGEGRLTYAQRTVERFDMPRSRPVLIRRENGYRAEFADLLREGEQSGGGYTVVVGYEDVHGSPQMKRIKEIITPMRCTEGARRRHAPSTLVDHRRFH